MNSFIFFFMIYEVARYTRYQTYRQHKDDTMEIYMMEGSLFDSAE